MYTLPHHNTTMLYAYNKAPQNYSGRSIHRTRPTSFFEEGFDELLGLIGWHIPDNEEIDVHTSLS